MLLVGRGQYQIFSSGFWRRNNGKDLPPDGITIALYSYTQPGQYLKSILSSYGGGGTDFRKFWRRLNNKWGKIFLVQGGDVWMINEGSKIFCSWDDWMINEVDIFYFFAQEMPEILYKYWLLMRGMVENDCSRGEIQPSPTGRGE